MTTDTSANNPPARWRGASAESPSKLASSTRKSAHGDTARVDCSPDDGCATLDGRNLQAWPSRQLARRRAVLPQHSTLSFDFLARDVVLIGRSPYVDEGLIADQRACNWALKMTDTEHLADQNYMTLSGGERQCVQLARVLAQLDRDADASGYLLLDEPTSALDLAHQHAVLSLARRLSRSDQLGVVVVLHDLNLAAVYADRIALLHHGRLEAFGTVSEVLTERRLETVFELPVMVMCHPGRSNCPLIIATAPEPLAGAA